MAYGTIRYDTIRKINVRSKADEMASLTQRKAQKRKNKGKSKQVAQLSLTNPRGAASVTANSKIVKRKQSRDYNDTPFVGDMSSCCIELI